MTKTKKFAELAKPVLADPARRARVEEYQQAIEAALRLADVRRARGVTQQELAQELTVSQSSISQLEHAEDPYLSSLRDYVAALGGRLEVTAVFPDERVVILE